MNRANPHRRDPLPDAGPAARPHRGGSALAGWVSGLSKLLVGVMLTAGLTGCREEAAIAEELPPAGPTALARVNDRLLTVEDLEAFIQLNGEDPSEIDWQRALNDLLTQEALHQAAQAAGVQADPARVEQYLKHWFGERPATDGNPHQQIERFLAVQQYLQRELEVESEISLQDLQRYYEVHMEEFQVDDQLLVLEILVKEHSLAEQIRSRLVPGDFRGFREAARTYSVGMTAAQGGELGVFQPGDLPQRFEELIFDLKLGEISSIFHSEHGFHLFLVEERTPRHAQKFYEVREEIFRRLVIEKEREQLDQIVARLRQAATIEVFPSVSNPLEKD